MGLSNALPQIMKPNSILKLVLSVALFGVLAVLPFRRQAAPPQMD